MSCLDGSKLGLVQAPFFLIHHTPRNCINLWRKRILSGRLRRMFIHKMCYIRHDILLHIIIQKISFHTSRTKENNVEYLAQDKERKFSLLFFRSFVIILGRINLCLDRWTYSIWDSLNLYTKISNRIKFLPMETKNNFLSCFYIIQNLMK